MRILIVGVCLFVSQCAAFGQKAQLECAAPARPVIANEFSFFLSTLQANDLKRLERILSPDLVVTENSGVVFNRSEYLDTLKGVKIQSINLEEKSLKACGFSSVGGGLGFVVGSYELKGLKGSQNIGGNYRFTAVLFKGKGTEGRWLLQVLHLSLVE